jgi:UDP-N-acetylmuramate dehydrogenase
VTPQVRDALAARLGHLVGFDEPLGPLTTYRLGGPAAALARPMDTADLLRVAEAVQATDVDVLVVGRGSNLLVADAGFDGLAVVTAGLGESIDFSAPDGDGRAEMTCDANVLMPVAARRSAAQSLTGFEWAVGVPGSVGGGVRMNAGGHGSDIAAALAGVVLCDLRAGWIDEVAVQRLGLRFRGSDLAPHQLVVSARFSLAYGDRERSENEIADIVRWRREHQPGGQNAGSVFVNPVPGEVAAGQLIDQLGLRGLCVGGAVVSEKHANFIQATPGATASDVRELIRLVRDRVADETGHVMRSEVREVGFDRGHDAHRNEHTVGVTR